MALRRLSTSSIQTNGKSSKLWDQTTFQSGMFALATVSLTSSASSVVFSNIPADYKHLQIRGIVRYSAEAGNNPMYMTFNSDSGSNYSWHGIFGDGASASAAAGSNRSRIDIDRIAGANAASNIFGTFVIDILDYANTSKFKTTRNLGGLDQNGSGFIFFESASWRSTDAVNTISFVPPSDNFVQFSHFALYGIKEG